MKKKSRVLAALLVSSMLFMNYYPALTYVNATGTSVSDSDTVTKVAEEEAREILTFGQFSYVVKSNGSVAIVKYLGNDKMVLIPDKIDSKSVTELEQEAVAYNDTVEYIIVPKSVNSIGNSAFYRCENLTAIVLSSNSIGFGFTLVEASKNLQNIYIPQGFDALALSAILVNDLGEDGAKKVNLTECDDIEAFAASLIETSDTEKKTEAASEPKVTTTNDTMATEKTEDTGINSVTINDAPKSLATQSSEDFVIEDGILVEYTGEGGIVEIPSDVTAISATVFKANTSITQIILPDGLQSIGDSAFYGCTALESISLPNQLKTIGNSAFSGCSGMTGGLVIPASVTRIGDSAFSGCSGLNGKLVIEAGTKTVGNYAFQSCSKLTGLELGNGITSIGGSAFFGCSGMTGDLLIPNSVTSIGGYAFSGCSGFDGVLTLSENITAINDSTFSSCKFSGTLTVPDKVKTIGSRAFYNCSNFTDIVFGTGLTNISSDYYSSSSYYMAFADCTGVKTITFLGTTVPIINKSITATSSDSTCKNYFFGTYSFKNLTTIYVPADSYSVYVSAYGSNVPSSVSFVTDMLQAKITGLKATNVYSKTVALSWNPHLCNDVVVYIVYRNGEEIGRTTTCEFIDRELDVSTTYEYSVSGCTEGNAETSTSSISVTTQPPKINQIKTANTLNKIGIGASTIYVYVTNTNNLKEFEGKNAIVNLYYMKNGERQLIGACALSETLGSPSTSVYTADWDISELSDGDYTVWFSITDIDGVTTEAYETITVDTSLPEKIINVTATGDIKVIYLSWSMSSEVDTTIYRIYRKSDLDSEFKLYAQINNRNTLNYSDTNVKSGRNYYYYVVGVNEFDQESEASEIAVATLDSDTTAPTVTKLTPSTGSYLRGNVSIGLTSQDNVAVTKALLYYSTDNGSNWVMFGRSSLGNFSYTLYTGDLPDGVIKVKGIAYDAEENESDPMVYTYYIDNTGPEKITGVSYVSTSITATLSWNDVSDNDISYFRVEAKDVDKGTYSKVMDVTRTLGANIYNLTPDNSYVYRVVGYDIHGNRGTPSDDITVQTLSDTTNPVITQIRPTSSYYAYSIPLSITATDEYNVRKITIQTSTDGTEWANAYTQHFTSNVSKSRTLSYSLPLDDFEEGYIYVRAIAADSADNKSDSSESAPYVQHIIDRTAPEAPQGVTAKGDNGYIYVSWTQGAENDLSTYALYRSESEDGIYTLVKNGLSVISYYDRDVKENTTYYYKLTVNDRAGNVSGYSESASASVIADTEKPTVVSVYPNSDSLLGKSYKTISALVTDNQEVDSVLFEYKKGSLSLYSTLKVVTNVSAYSRNVTATVPIDEFSNGDTVYIRVTAIDKSGNRSESIETHYTVDLTPPSVESVYAAYDDESVLVSWNGLVEEDLIGYRVYRKTGQSGSYSLIAQRQAVSGQTLYSCYDYNLSIAQTTYYYKVEAVDSCGNTSSLESAAVSIPDRSVHLPTADISCESTMEVGVEYIIDASASIGNSAIVSYLFDLGDGTTSTDRRTVHKYSEIGTYTITLTVMNDYGNQSTITKTIEVKDRTLLGYAKIRIIDENGKIVPNAPVYFDLGEATQVIKTTDGNGYVSFTAEVGKHTVGCVIADNEWLPVKKDIIIKAKEETSISMTLIHHKLIEGEFEITRMTFDEIVAAGIDVSKPENQYFVNVNVTLKYGEGRVETSFKYNEITGQTLAKPTIVNTSDGQKRAIVPKVLSTNNQNKLNNADSNNGNPYDFSSETSIAYLDVPVGVSSLKEFFDVNLHIINNASSDFSMLDNVIDLNVPDGLTIVDTYSTQKNKRVTIPEIKGQTTETITWILRGDVVGQYYLSADYSGILSEFNEPIHTQFVATEPINVYGMSNMKMLIEIPDELDNGTFYYNVSLINQGRTDVYRPIIDTGDDLFETELFNEYGANISEDVTLSAQQVSELGLSESVDENVNVLQSGCKLTKHYMSKNQTSYTLNKQKISDWSDSYANTYGVTVEVVTKELSYFKSYLSSTVDAIEKADNVFKSNITAYEYLMNDEYYVYYSMYKSTCAVDGSLTTNEEETLWNLLKFAAGDGDFKALFGSDDEKLIQTIILDAMELNVENEEHLKYLKALDWVDNVDKWAKEQGLGEWVGDITEALQKKYQSVEKEVLQQMSYVYANKFLQDLEEKNSYYKWDLYKMIITGEYLEFDVSMSTDWGKVMYSYSEMETNIFKEYNLTYHPFSQTESGALLHKLLSKDSIKVVWKAIGYGEDMAKSLVKASEKTSTDVGIFIAAQGDINSCNLFLDTLINYSNPTGDGVKVKNAAEKIKVKVNEFDPYQRFMDNFKDEMVQNGLKWTKKTIMKKLDITPNALVTAVKVALKITISVGDNIFNVSDRHDIADNIRFVSIMSESFKSAIVQARSKYDENKTETNAYQYMQLIAYLLNLREIGEVQVAAFGISYEVLPGALESKDLLFAVREMSGVSEAQSWIEWRDYVEDKISWARVQLLKNPIKYDEKYWYAPVVSFDYSKMQTVQSFSDIYEYSINGGKTWQECTGNPIHVSPNSYSVDLYVRRISTNNTNETLTARLTILGIPSISKNDVLVKETANGYRIDGLDNQRAYEVTFAASEQSYDYDDTLSIKIEKGHYSYEYNTGERYPYVYIRSVADSSRFASYIRQFTPYPMCELTVITEETGSVAGVGKYEYGESATLVATPLAEHLFSGWYENDELVGTDDVLNLTMYSDHTITAKFVLANHNCNDYVEEWIVDSESDCYHEGSRHGICTYCNNVVTEATQKTAHKAGEWEVVTAATLLTEGLRVKHCTICGDEVEREVIAALTDDFGLTFDPTNEVLIGVPEEMTPDELIAHYEALDLSVTVTDADGNEPDLVGTGCIVSVNGEDFTVIVNGDVTGDGEIDVFDLFAMTDHLNDEKELTGVYFIAACYLGNEDFDLFDMFALQAHINQD